MLLDPTLTMPRIAPLALVSLICLTTAGCANKQTVEAPKVGPDYSRQLPPGQSALRLITDPARLPDIAGAYANRDVYLLDAIDQSLVWFAAPSSQTYFPFESFTHEQARVSLMAFKQLLSEATTEAD